MTPPHPHLEALPKPSRRAIALGSFAVLAGAAVMAVLGFTAGLPAHGEPVHAAVSPTPHEIGGQLTTLSLTEVRGHEPLGHH